MTEPTTPGIDGLMPLASRLPAVELTPIMPRGFRAGGMAAGIKRSGRPDLAIVATTADANP